MAIGEEYEVVWPKYPQVSEPEQQEPRFAPAKRRRTRYFASHRRIVTGRCCQHPSIAMSDHYQAVLADLIAARDRIDAAIAALTRAKLNGSLQG